MSAVSKMVHENFEAIFSMISTPFLVVTVPVVGLVLYLIIDKFTKQERGLEKQSAATNHLADEMGKLAVSIAHMQGAVK